jgi:O-antigen/teichoic acid export membrane protein
MISLLAGPIGVLQGEGRIPLIAATRAIETAVRALATFVLVLLVKHSASVAVLGFPIGSAAALAFALRLCRRGFPLMRMDRATALHLVRQALSLGGIQVLLSMLGALDSVYVDSSLFSADAVASYQSATLVSKIPLYMSAAVSTAYYTPMVAAQDEAAAGAKLRSAMASYSWLSLGMLLCCVTLPRVVLDIVVPARYGQTLGILQVCIFTGVAIGAINVLTTAHQARARFRGCIWLLTGAVMAQGAVLLVVGRVGDVGIFTLSNLAICVLALVTLTIDGRAWLKAPRFRLRAPAVAACMLGLVAYWLHSPLTWVPLIGLAAAAAAYPALSGPRRDGTRRRGRGQHFGKPSLPAERSTGGNTATLEFAVTATIDSPPAPTGALHMAQPAPARVTNLATRLGLRSRTARPR